MQNREKLNLLANTHQRIIFKYNKILKLIPADCTRSCLFYITNSLLNTLFFDTKCFSCNKVNNQQHRDSFKNLSNICDEAFLQHS